MRAALVTGSRHWSDPTPIHEALSAVGADLVIEGKAKGADMWAKQWAETHGMASLSWPDNHWGAPDYITGPMRNGYMVQVAAALKAAGWDVYVLAFPDANSRGTWSCVTQAHRAGLDVRVYNAETAEMGR